MTSYIAVAGVTGKLGSLIATYLLEFPDVVVHGFCRSPEKVSPSLTNNTERFKLFSGSASSLDDARKAITGCKTVICAYSNYADLTFFFEGQKVLIDACEAEGVDRYFASDYTLDYRGWELGDLPAKDAQIQTYRYLRDGNEKGELKVKGVHLLAGPFVEILPYLFPKGQDRQYWGTGAETWNFITYDTMAKYTAQVAMDKARPTGFLKFGDFQTNILELAATIGKMKGDGSPLPFKFHTMAEAEQQMDTVRKDGTWWEHLTLFSCYYFPDTTPQLGERLDNKRYPEVKTISLEEAVTRYVDI